MFFRNFEFLLIVFSSTIFSLQAENCQSNYQPYFNGTCMPPGDCTGAIISNNNKCTGNLKCCIPDKNMTVANPIFVSESELEEILTIKNKRINFISKVLKGPNRNPTCFQKAFYLSQLAYESSKFLNSEESGTDFSKYDGKLGNNNTGDGAKYKGRGFIQLTGRSNYIRAGEFLKIDLENQPELAAFPSIASKIAQWYWENGTSENLNTFSDGTFYGFSRITGLINGALNGFKDRVEFLEAAIKKFECGALMKGRGENCTINKKQGVCKPICNVGFVGKKYCGCNGKTVANQCKGPANIRCCDENCSADMDLTFVLDASGSVGSNGFLKAKDFTRKFINRLNIGPNKTQVALINYSSKSQIEIYLNSNKSKTHLLDFISNNVKYTGGSTATGDALNQCFDIYSTNKGMRNSSTGVGKVIIVLTDGKSNKGKAPIPVANSLKAKKISIISIGVGQSLNLKELKNISSNNRFYRVADYDQVSLIYDELNQVSCLQPAIIPNATVPIEVEKDTFKYFTYYVQNLNSTLGIRINLNIIFGDVELFSSLINENPNDYEVLDSKNRRKRNTNTNNLLELGPKSNFSQVYIGVKGLNDYNQFSIEIDELDTLSTSSNSSPPKFNFALSMLFIITINFLFRNFILFS